MKPTPRCGRLQRVTVHCISCLLLVASSAAWSPSIIAKAAGQAPQETPETQYQTIGPDRAQQNYQVELLKEQNELLRRYNNELIQVITWSLTFAAVFLIGVLGLIGFFTTRRYDQEKEALRSHLDGKVATTMAQVEERLNEKAQAIRAAQEANVKELTEAVHQEADNAASRIIDPLSQRMRTAERLVANLEIDFKREQAKMWEGRRVPTNALREWTEIVNLANSLNNNYLVAEGLDEIRRLLTAGTRIDAQHTTQLHSTLSSLPDEYQPVVIKIKSLL